MGAGPSSPPHGFALAARALRLPFLGASLLPFAAGVARARPGAIDWTAVLCAGTAVAGVHLACNLANELADDASGVDARESRFFGLYGGSKVLPARLLSRGWYRRATVACLGVAAVALAALALRGRSPLPLAWGAVATLLGLQYSLGPLRLMKRGLGEPAVVALFGPGTVLAGQLAARGAVAGSPAWMAATALGLATAGVLVLNEVPDAVHDAAVGKRTLVVRLGRRGGVGLFAACDLGALVLLAGQVGPHAAGLAALSGCAVLVAYAVLEARRAVRTDDAAAMLPAARLALAAHAVACLAAAVSS